MNMQGVIAIFGCSTLLGLAVACAGGSETIETATAETESRIALEKQIDELIAQYQKLTIMSTNENISPSGLSDGTSAEGVISTESSTMENVAVEFDSEQLVDTQGFASPPLERSVSSGSSLLRSSVGQSGIWVTGEAVLSLEPDVAFINIGVETSGDTVSSTRAEAADSMDAAVKSMLARGLDPINIQTTSFNIWPQYEWREVFENDLRINKQILVGYKVTNLAVIKVHELKSLGVLIDDLAEAGGDAIRINGISFSIEDPQRFQSTLRATAVEDALVKAQEFTDLTGVNVGSLIYIAQSDNNAPVQAFDTAFAEVSVTSFRSASTPIGTGEFDLNMIIQAVFNIEY